MRLRSEFNLTAIYTLGLPDGAHTVCFKNTTPKTGPSYQLSNPALTNTSTTFHSGRYQERMKAKREYRCGERLANTGRICGKTFERRWNLKRHIRLVHQSDGLGATAFVYLTADSFATASPKAGPKPTAPLDPSSCEEDDRRGPRATPNATRDAEAAGDDQRRRGYHDRSRGQDRSLYTRPIPVYSVKRSSVFPRQQKAISWLTETAKDAHDNRVSELMGSWGLRPSHSGTCLLIPSNWARIPPSSLMERFSHEKCPKIDDPHMVGTREGRGMEQDAS